MSLSVGKNKGEEIKKVNATTKVENEEATAENEKGSEPTDDIIF